MNRGKITGMLLLLIMISSVFPVMTHLTTGSDITRTMVRNGYVVNPDNVTISIDGNTTSVLIGQNVQFMCGGKKTGQVTIRGIKDTPTEGYLFKSNTTGWFDTSGMEEGLYNATYGDCWELLAVPKPEMDLRLMVGTKEVTSICEGTPLRVHLETNLDKNDCVDLVVRTPEGYRLKQNPADPNQKFVDINVSQLLEYGSENESKWINTTGWKLGTYTFSVRTEEENARGLDVCSKERELAVLRAEINIEAEKCVVVESEKVRLTVTGAAMHNMTISSSDPTHTIFPAGYEDNPPFDTSGFNDTIDEDGKRKYVVYFNDTGTYTIEVTDTTAGLSDYDCVDILVSEKRVTFDVPSRVVIGEKFTIKGATNVGNTVDIAVENYVYPELNDIPIEKNGEFEKEIDTGTTNITPFTVPGSVLLEVYIDRAAGAGEIGANETEDGRVAILMVGAGLTAELSTDSVAQGGNFMVNGTVGGVDNVDIVVVAPKGSNGSMICPTGTPLQAGTNIYYAVVPVTAECAFTKKICVGTDVDTGSYLVVVLSKGRDGMYGRGYNNLTEALADYNLTEKTQAQILAILEDATVGAAGSDDLMWIEYINVIPGLNVSISKNAVLPGDSFEVYGNASSDYVEVVAISPRGGYGIGLGGLYGVSIYTVPAFKPWTQPEAGGNLTTDEPLIINNTANRENGTIVIINVTGPEDDIDINVTEKAIKFNIPSTYVIGENLTINGTAKAGTSVDIAIDDTVKTVDIPIENGTFHTDISTVGYIPGSYLIEGFIDRNFSVGEDVSGEESDGSAIIIIPAPDLTANLSTSIAQPGEILVINGTATGTDHVDIITISPFGGNGARLYEKSYPGVPGITNESIDVDENYTFSKTINISESADAGEYVIWISVPGRDDVYGTWSETNGVDNASELIKHIIDEYCNGDISNLHSKTQDQILDMLKDATINMVGSDDLACIMELSVEYLSYSFYKKIKVNSGADTGNYTILVLSPGIDGVYGDSSYKYIDSILDLDGAGPELGAIDVSNKTKEEIVSTIKDVTIDQAGSDDLLWKGHLTVYQPKVIYVDDDFENDPANHRWNTIQKGINDANSGDMVYVYAGNYNENVILNKSITLQGEDRDNTIIDGGGNGDVINVTADNCMISEFTVQNGNCGIMMYESSNNTVMSNNASSNNYGIDLKWSDNNNITNNTANFNSIGIHLFHSNNNMISNNILNLNEKYGIKLMDSSDYNTVSGNIASSNKIGITLSEALDNNILDNTITNNRFAIYLLHSNNNTISKNICLNNWIGIELWYSNANTISNNNCSLNKDEGIYLQLSNNNAISNNNCSNNYNWSGINLLHSNNNIISNNNYSVNGYYGIDLCYSNNNTISNNICSSNEVGGIYLRYSSNNNTIFNNNCIANNYYGIYLGSNSNLVYLNNFINNSQNVYSSNFTNIWNSTEKITYTYRGKTYTNYLGNHWDDYTGRDTDGDGIGDTPYSIDGDNDSYPLMMPFENYFLTTENIFDTGESSNPYPSISGTHNGTITPNQTITATKLYTYPCPGTGGHTEYARIWNKTWNATATREGYAGDWHNITFNRPVVLLANKTYSYTIRTGSYPQIHHNTSLLTPNGWINCTKFVDANGKIYDDWIPAIRLE